MNASPACAFTPSVHLHPAKRKPTKFASCFCPPLRLPITPRFCLATWSRPILPRIPPCATAASPQSPDPPLNDKNNADPPPSASFLTSLYKFSRPHTIRGTILGSIAGCARALVESPVSINWALLPRAAMGLLALLCGNAFIVGINQIYDVRIDQINKPFLPLAAGTMSTRAAWLVVIATGVIGLSLVKRFFSSLIFGLYSFGMLIGSLYSIPPFQFKRFPLVAALTISCVRGFLLNFGVYHATKNALGLSFAWSPPISFLAVFMSVFAIVIALAKDMPDIKGDVSAGIPTYASRIGTPRMIRLVVALLSSNYAFAIATAIVAPPNALNRAVMLVGHTGLAVYMAWYMRNRVQPTSQASVQRFYAFIWRLFYAEYLLFPFV